jgi:AraC-like DNA-binding protein
MKLNPISTVVRRSIRSAQTLKAALEAFVNSIAREIGADIYWIVYKGAELRVCRRHRASADSDEKIYTDLDFFIDLTIIVRQFAGKKWKPKRIAFQFWPPAGELMRGYFPNTHFVFDKTSSWIELPRSLLLLPRQTINGAEDSALENAALSGLGAIEGAGFVHALKQALRTCLSEGYPDIDRAAKIMCTSVRTLQRNLARAGLTYSKLVEFARFEVAAEMLKKPNLKIIDIAYALGYQDPSHFSRAFRRFAGQTPREFRATRIGKLEPI